MNNNPKVTFKILEVNTRRAMRTQDYIRVEVFEDDESVGWWWQSPNLIRANMKRFGQDAYINLLEFKQVLLNVLMLDEKVVK